MPRHRGGSVGGTVAVAVVGSLVLVLVLACHGGVSGPKLRFPDMCKTVGCKAIEELYRACQVTTARTRAEGFRRRAWFDCGDCKPECGFAEPPPYPPIRWTEATASQITHCGSATFIELPLRPTEDSCYADAHAAFGVQAHQRNALEVGTWGHVPPGCGVYTHPGRDTHPGAAHWNTNVNSTGNDGSWLAVTSKSDEQVWDCTTACADLLLGDLSAHTAAARFPIWAAWEAPAGGKRATCRCMATDPSGCSKPASPVHVRPRVAGTLFQGTDGTRLAGVLRGHLRMVTMVSTQTRTRIQRHASSRVERQYLEARHAELNEHDDSMTYVGQLFTP